MICVTTASYSINVNGDLHGFFRGKRGLRQGDPLSPYLFTLVMEVLTLILDRNVGNSNSFIFHPKCEKIGLINLCIADDLILFCYGNVCSASVIMDSLLEFTNVSGLAPSLSKSTGSFANVPTNVKQETMEIMPFEEGQFPVRYLGVPLISTRLVHKDCRVLVEKVKNRLGDRRNKSLLFAGRLQLIISVLFAMHIYWSSVFILPESITTDIEKLLRGYLWCNGEMKKGKAKVAWEDLCVPRDECGLGLECCFNVLPYLVYALS